MRKLDKDLVFIKELTTLIVLFNQRIKIYLQGDSHVR